MNSERWDWVDYSKGIGMILVVVGHVLRGMFSANLVPEGSSLWMMEEVIYAFHMPLFFILSGLFFESSFRGRNGIAFFKNKTSTVIYPYVIWMLIQGLIEVGMSNYTNGEPVVLMEIFKFWVPRAQYWFLFSLFMVISASYLVYNFLGIKGLGVISVALYATGSFFSERYYDFIANYMLYFFIGIIVFRFSGRIKILALSLLPLLLILFTLTLLNMPSGLLRDLVLAISGSFVVITFSMVLLSFNRVGWLLHVGKISMVIYLVHIIFGSGFRIISQKIFGIDLIPYHLLLGSVSGLTGSVLFYYFIKKLNVRYVFKFG